MFTKAFLADLIFEERAAKTNGTADWQALCQVTDRQQH